MLTSPKQTRNRIFTVKLSVSPYQTSLDQVMTILYWP